MAHLRKFEAWVSCPRCARFAMHDFRLPKPAPTVEEIEAWEAIVDRIEVMGFGLGLVRVYEDPPRPVDESEFEVIRTCKCGHKWGEN
jgi:hypothetical protein